MYIPDDIMMTSPDAGGGGVLCAGETHAELQIEGAVQTLHG